MGMFIWNISYNGDPNKPVLPYGTKLNHYVFTTLPFDYIDVSNLDAMEGFKYMFTQSVYQTIPPLSDTSGFHIWADAFSENPNLTTIPEIDTSGGYAFANMFKNCYHLTTIPRLNISGCTDPLNLSGIFSGCTALTSIGFEGAINISLSLASCASLSDDTILLIAYLLYNGAGSQTLTLSTALSSKATDYVKLNDDADGLVFCDSTDPDAISTLSDYITNKNWTLLFA